MNRMPSSNTTQPACSRRAPRRRGQHAVDRLRPEHASQEVVGTTTADAVASTGPVAIERQQRERAEHVEVGLDAAAGEMDEQRRGEHLSDRDDMTRRCPPRPPASPSRRAVRRSGHRGRSCGVDVDVRRAGGAHPGARQRSTAPRRSRRATGRPSGRRTGGPCAAPGSGSPARTARRRGGRRARSSTTPRLRCAKVRAPFVPSAASPRADSYTPKARIGAGGARDEKSAGKQEIGATRQMRPRTCDTSGVTEPTPP